MATIELDHRRINYQDHGTGLPVLFGHSYLWGAEMWRPQVDALAEQYRCIVPELWGHGGSDSPGGGDVYHLNHLTEDFVGFVNALGLDRFAIVGLSIGGMWGFRLALNLPDRIVGLVLAGTDLGSESKETRQRFLQMIEAVAAAGCVDLAMIQTLMPFFFSDMTLRKQPPFLDQFRSVLSEIPGEKLPGILALGRGIFQRDCVLDRMAEINCPACIVVGEQDRSRPLFEAERMAEGISRAQLHVLKGAGHICNLESSNRFTFILRSFLTGLGEA